MQQPHSPIFNRTIYNALIERHQLDFVFTQADVLLFNIESFKNASLDEIQHIVGLFNDSEFRTFWNEQKQKERNEILSSLPVSCDGNIREIIRTISEKSKMMLIYDFIREFYEYDVPTNVIGTLDAYKIYLEYQHITIPVDNPSAFHQYSMKKSHGILKNKLSTCQICVERDTPTL